MLNSPETNFGAEKRSKTCKSIVPLSSAKTQQYSAARSPNYPALPQHLDKLIDAPWTRENSRLIDKWLLYCQEEFEIAGGLQ